MAATTKVVTGKVRLSYAFLTEPRADDNGVKKYSVVVLIPKSDKATMEKIGAAQQAALEQGKSTKFDGKIPNNWHNTVKDGDDEDVTDLERNPEYAGHFYLSVSTGENNRPGVVDRNLQPILDATEVYSGMYARVSMNAFPYNYKGKKGVSFALNHVQKIADGDPLGGRTRAEDDFDELDDDLV